MTKQEMTKQEEIRDWLEWNYDLTSAGHILSYLHSRGVVIKGHEHPRYAGYFTVEPIIKEE